MYDGGEGELSDAAAALDWLQSNHPNINRFWIAGFSFGVWIGMQLLMRRPELSNFVAISPPANMYDFNFLAPCPISGQVIQGDQDLIVKFQAVEAMVQKLKNQKGVSIDYHLIKGADHFFSDHMPMLKHYVDAYINSCFINDNQKQIA
jgi:alpha/beta superfamily hydrolase